MKNLEQLFDEIDELHRQHIDANEEHDNAQSGAPRNKVANKIEKLKMQMDRVRDQIHLYKARITAIKEANDILQPRPLDNEYVRTSIGLPESS